MELPWVGYLRNKAGHRLPVQLIKTRVGVDSVGPILWTMLSVINLHTHHAHARRHNEGTICAPPSHTPAVFPFLLPTPTRALEKRIAAVDWTGWIKKKRKSDKL